MPEARKAPQFGKYREIVLAVAFFLIFDLAVLVLNFYTSYRISEDAVSINLAGRQRMLSQRMAKATLALDAEMRTGSANELTRQELREAVGLFDVTLNAFAAGGSVRGADGKQVVLRAVDDPAGREVLAQAKTLWQPYRDILNAVGEAPVLTAETLATASAAVLAQNKILLGQMNALTVRLEAVAATQAERLRLVQTIGIVFALLNFLFILFKFIRQLRESDSKAELAQRETAEILGTVQEGLFLIDREMKVGLQQSASLQPLLGSKLPAGTDFALVLRGLLKSEDYSLATDYIRLLLGDRVKEALVRDLNPLRELPIETADGVRNLSFSFNRVMVDGQLSHLLVTVSDVTELVSMRGELAAAQGQADQQLSALLELARMQPAELSRFIAATEASLLDINDRLRAIEGSGGNYRRLADHIFRAVHTIKANASLLGASFIVHDADLFEGLLTTLRGRDTLTGDELIGVSVHLKQLFERLSWLRTVMARFTTQVTNVSADTPDLARAIGSLAQRIASDHSKTVNADIQLDKLGSLEQKAASAVQVIAAQLVRNAVAHGLEVPQERFDAGKQVAGQLRVALTETAPSRYALSVRDDGRGICAKQIRSTLLKSGRFSPEALAELSDRQVLMEIFRPGFTTAAKQDEHAGRGVGMDVVAEAVRRIGGHLKLFTQPGAYTEFRVEFSA